MDNSFMDFSSFEAKRRPDQQTYKLNAMRQNMMSQQYQLVINSSDGKQKIIIGNQPKPNEGKFGIYLYAVAGDRLTEIKSIM